MTQTGDIYAKGRPENTNVRPSHRYKAWILETKTQRIKARAVLDLKQNSGWSA